MFQEYLQRILLTAPPILLALTVHECAHAWVADRMGDPTARMLGRVTLNPIKHLDPVGTIALFLSGMFGWAKPVPINPRNFKHLSRSVVLVSLAGPLSNITLAAVFAIVHKVFLVAGAGLLASFPGVYKPLFVMVELSIILNVALAVFNLVPIPPLDGSKVLAAVLPPDKAFAFSRLEPYGFIILIVLIMSGVLNRFITPLIFLMVGLLTGGAY
ncbi:MAG TPA: site-2 protease family protein [Thermodesulfobacteriota bacterium]|nr:site-2 protease family protein [Thermodesulfobacteriota bacterium]